MVMVLLAPFAFIPLLGYAVHATRSAAGASSAGPPPWRLSARLLADGVLMSAVLVVTTAPFAILLFPLAGAFHNPNLWRADGTLLDVEAYVTAAFIVALPWGALLLLLMPHATVRFAVTQKAGHLFDFGSSIRSVRREFAAWNVAIAAIVTAWAVGLACVALLCIGAFPGVFYAILVSAHAAATLHPEGENPSAG